MVVLPWLAWTLEQNYKYTMHKKINKKKNTLNKIEYNLEKI